MRVPFHVFQRTTFEFMKSMWFMSLFEGAVEQEKVRRGVDSLGLVVRNNRKRSECF